MLEGDVGIGIAGDAEPVRVAKLEQLVDAALAGLDAGEAVTVPSMPDVRTWSTLEAARVEFLKAVMYGKVAPRYH
jgi:hypothetical protein